MLKHQQRLPILRSHISYAVLCVACFMSGCTVGPDYQKPQATEAPSAFRNATGTNTQVITESRTIEPWAIIEDPQLNTLLRQTVAANKDIQMAQARLFEARASRVAAGAQQKLNVNASGRAVKLLQSENSPFVPGSDNDFEPKTNHFLASFDASWEIDIFGGTRRAVESADARQAAARASLEEMLLTISAEVALNYAELRNLQQRKIITEKNIRIQQETLDFVTDRLDVGLGNELAVAQARAQLVTTKSTLPAINAGIQIRIYIMNTLLGSFKREHEEILQTFTPLPEIPATILVGIPSDVLQRRPDVRLAERQLAAETADIGVAVADLFPKFTLTGSTGLESGSSLNFFDASSKTWSIGPGVQWKLFQGGAVRANIVRQKAQAAAALAQYEKMVLQVFQEVDSALMQHRSERLTTQQLQEAVYETERTVTLARTLYEEGLSDFLSLLNAEAQLALVEDQMTQSKTREWTSLIRLYKALGGSYGTGADS